MKLCFRILTRHKISEYLEITAKGLMFPCSYHGTCKQRISPEHISALLRQHALWQCTCIRPRVLALDRDYIRFPSNKREGPRERPRASVSLLAYRLHDKFKFTRAANAI